MGTGRPAGAAERDDVLDLGERQAEPARLTDEGEQAEDVGGIAPVAGWLASWRRENAERLVQPQRLAAQAAPLGDFPDQQAVVLHEESLKPAPWGKVKSAGSRAMGRSRSPTPS